LTITTIKKALRISGTNTAYDDEIEILQKAAEADIIRMGIKRLPENRVLCDHAVILYCKAHFGYNDDTSGYQNSYDALTRSLALSYPAGR